VTFAACLFAGGLGIDPAFAVVLTPDRPRAAGGKRLPAAPVKILVLAMTCYSADDILLPRADGIHYRRAARRA
jgi:hypothetical protein